MKLTRLTIELRLESSNTHVDDTIYVKSAVFCMKKATENWLKIAQSELSAADVLFENSNYLKALEHCHAALEKLLKGIIVEHDKQLYKIHDLLKLVSEALVDNLQQDIKKTLNELNNIYMSTRYPDEFDLLHAEYDKSRTEDILKETKRIFKWLKEKLK